MQVGCTPLHRAASTGKSALCELLIEEGAEVDATDRTGQTPLMSAVICQNKEVLSLSLEKPRFKAHAGEPHLFIIAFTFDMTKSALCYYGDLHYSQIKIGET